MGDDGRGLTRDNPCDNSERMRSKDAVNKARRPTITKSFGSEPATALVSQMAARRRRRILFRSTAFPTFRDSTKPNLGPPIGFDLTSA